MIDQYLSTFKKYAVFTGRASRKEYWTFYIGNMIIAFILGFIEGASGLFDNTLYSVFGTIFNLVILLPSIGAAIRRMHDLDKSGWFILVPIYNIILTLTPGQKEENKFGPAPIEITK